MSADRHDFAPGAVIAKRYRLDRLLGAGGMGVVWAATHTVTRRSVAMKFLRAGPGGMKQELRQRFLREARAASAVRHPNVVTISDVFELDDDTPVMVMDLLVGETLGQKLARELKLSLEQTATILLQIISAVGAAHESGIVHRDLKPDNIFIVEGAAPGAVRVLDFGIAKVLDSELEGDSTGLVTKTGTILGTPCYMSPEQALGEQDIDHRSDVWSLGVILYECLSGVRPIASGSMGQVVKQIVVDGVRPIEEHERNLPPAVSNLVGRMLSRDRAKRPSDLNRVLDVLGTFTQIVVPPFGSPARDADWSVVAYAERETLRASASDKPPERPAAVLRLDTEGPQLVPNGDRPVRRSWVAPTVAAGLMLASIAAWRARALTLKGDESKAVDASSTKRKAAASATPVAPEPAAEPRVIALSLAPSSDASAKSGGLQKDARRAGSAPARSSAGVASSLPSVARSAPSPSAAPPTPLLAASAGTFSGGLSEKPPF